MYNDYFDLSEPSTGDIVFEEIKRVLGTLKEEIKTELEALRKENAELRLYKEDRDRLQRDLERVKSECNRRIREAEATAENRVFESLLGEHMIQAWKVGHEYILPQKCDKCDANRKLHFTSPRGRELTEECECAKSQTVYKPIPALLARFQVNPKARARDQFTDKCFSGEKPLHYWYTTESSTLNGAEFRISEESEVGAPRASDLKPFSELNEWHAVFTDMERCQEFCNYLAEQDANKAKTNKAN